MVSDNFIVGKWVRRYEVTYVFSKTEMVIVENGWKGPWKIENKKLIVTLNMCGNQLATTDTKILTYELPLRKMVQGSK